MLVYHPIYDSYHCIFRILCILHDIQQVDIEVDLIRILDFYVLFPSRLKNIKFKNSPTGLVFSINRKNFINKILW